MYTEIGKEAQTHIYVYAHTYTHYSSISPGLSICQMICLLQCLDRKSLIPPPLGQLARPPPLAARHSMT